MVLLKILYLIARLYLSKYLDIKNQINVGSMNKIRQSINILGS